MTEENRIEISDDDFNPFDPEFIRNPEPSWQYVLSNYPIAFHRDLQMWFVNSHELCAEMLKNNDFTTNYRHWEYAEPEKSEAEKIDFERMMDHSLFMTDRKEHFRLRKLIAPAFSRPVMEQIDEKIRDLIAERFDEIGTPQTFNVYDEIACRLPARTISRMIGVPPADEKLFIRFSNSVVHASRINLPQEERGQAMRNGQEGIDYFKAEIAARRAMDDPGDDFLGHLIKSEEDNDKLSDWDIIAVISALIAAGSDTAMDLHTYLIKGLLDNPEQFEHLREQPDLMENAIIELMRYGSMGKFPFFRFATKDVEFGGQQIKMGQAILVNLGTAWHDPAKWGEPNTLDITRNLEGHIVFGAGAHFCVGTYLVRVQGRLMLQEFMRRYPDAELLNGDGNLEYDFEHHNARRITNLEVRTHAESKRSVA